jgi:RNA polymerase sigma-70 factor (subfamily 1)
LKHSVFQWRHQHRNLTLLQGVLEMVRIMNSTHDDERRLLLDGGQTALASLFSTYSVRLERIVSFRLDPRIRGRIDAADILQEAFLEASDRLQSFLESTDISFFVWLRQQTLQTLIDVHRRQFRQKRDVNREIRFASTGPSDGTSLSIAQFLIGQLTSPSEVIANAEEMQWLQDALNAMNEVDREILALRHFEQLGNNQVAEILGLSPTAASNRYLRAAARLSEIMQRLTSKTGPAR